MNYTNENILSNPNIVNEMTTEDITQYKITYFHKQVKSRPLIDKRLKHLKHLKLYNERLDRAYECIDAVWLMIQGFLTHSNPEDRVHRYGRHVSNGLHDMPHIWTGYESLNSIKRRKANKKYNPTDEHFYPRQYAGEHIMRQAIILGDGWDRCTLAKLAYKFCRTNRVTKEENKDLEPYQKTDTFTYPKSSYRNAKIELEKVRKGQDTYDPIFKELIESLEQKTVSHNSSSINTPRKTI